MLCWQSWAAKLCCQNDSEASSSIFLERWHHANVFDPLNLQIVQSGACSYIVKHNVEAITKLSVHWTLHLARMFDKGGNVCKEFLTLTRWLHLRVNLDLVQHSIQKTIWVHTEMTGAHHNLCRLWTRNIQATSAVVRSRQRTRLLLQCLSSSH